MKVNYNPILPVASLPLKPFVNIYHKKKKKLNKTRKLSINGYVKIALVQAIDNITVAEVSSD